jgi:hypothetical protein
VCLENRLVRLDSFAGVSIKKVLEILVFWWIGVSEQLKQWSCRVES